MKKGKLKRMRKKRKLILQKETYSKNKLFKTLKECEPMNYKNYIQMTDEVFDDLLSKVLIYIQRKDTLMRMAIPAKIRLAITLRFLATGCSYEDLKFSINVSAQSVGKIVIETCEAIVKVLKSFIKLPETPNEWMDVSDHFYEKSMFPNCLGYLAGKHVNIMRPLQSGSSYLNYKKTFSFILLAIVNSNNNFLMVDVCKNGRKSDDDVFSKSKFFEKLENLQPNLPDPKSLLTGQEPLPYVFVSDVSYTAQHRNILKPFEFI